MHDGSNQSIKDHSNTLGRILSLEIWLTKLHNMNKEKIYNSFNLAYKDYDLKTKSDHWKIKNNKFLKKIKQIKLENFRKNILSDGLDDQGNFFPLVENLIDLTDLCGKKFIDEFKENEIGNPDNFYVIGGEKYNFNDLFIIQFFI